jgi:TetR/AcrR family tetracycline transcriptional repressor
VHQGALCREHHQLGQAPFVDQRDQVRALQFQVIGFVLVERNRERAPQQHPGEPELWDAETAEQDPALAGALAAPPDPDRLFAASVRAIVASLWSDRPLE